MKRFISLICSFIMLLTAVSAPFYAYAVDVSNGVDVSEHNGDTDYSYIRSQDNSFVMIRLGYYNHLDKEFWNNVKKANDEGMDYGVYLFSEAFNEKEANIEADFVIDTLSQLVEKGYGEYLTLPVAYDLESSRIIDKSLGNCSKAQITKHMTVFCDKIRNAGYTPMVYANLNWFTNYIDINTAVAKDYKIWYAYYNSTDKAPSTDDYKMIGNTGVKADIWQYYAPEYSSPTQFDKNILYYSVKENVTLSAKSYTYSGKVQSPAVTVKTKSGKLLAEGKDYTLTYSNKSSTNPGRYTIKVDVLNDYFGKQTFSYEIKPRTTAITSASATAYGFKVNWNKIGETTGYQIQYSTKSDFSGAATVYGGAANTTSKTITGRAAGTKYYIRVRTYKNIGNSEYVWGNWSSAKAVTTPSKPNNTTTKSVSGVVNGFKVNWTKVSNTTGYQIQYSTRSDFNGAATVYGGAANTTSKTITGRAAGTKYYVRVRTYKTLADGSRVWGNWTSAKAVTTKVQKATLKSVSAVSRGFKATWNKIGGVTGYQLQYSTRSDFRNAATVYAGNSSAVSKTITGRARNTKYYVRVRGYKNNKGSYVYGAWSGAKAVTTK